MGEASTSHDMTESFTATSGMWHACLKVRVKQRISQLPAGWSRDDCTHTPPLSTTVGKFRDQADVQRCTLGSIRPRSLANTRIIGAIRSDSGHCGWKMPKKAGSLDMVACTLLDGSLNEPAGTLREKRVRGTSGQISDTSRKTSICSGNKRGNTLVQPDGRI
ncbi:hypothetical protein OBBRIDRAFT_660468 [Obba rivulosa]|uniref:Uncharacterized protein n=1 Tax=Obba rivulosa TaxID=1052685 RepID=A0A8E2ARD8_9APHY|nr:hypothetical protein OBBRIDRAFT_660468 [Obba rivulosa]